MYPTQQQVDYTTDIATVLDDFVAREKRASLALHPHYESLWAEIERLLKSGGKRLRPRLAVLAYRAFGGDNVSSILPAAAALELLHLGMLVHDDIIDRDNIRYGVDNIAGRYDKQFYQPLVKNKEDRAHYATSAALLAGDLLLSSTYLLVTECDVSPEKVIATQKLFGQSIFEVIGGELLDTETAFRGDDGVSAEVIAQYKTASYTFILPMLIGAQLANLAADKLVHVAEFGRNLGIAFQLRDDIIGIFGNEAETGKTTVGDIREGKRTYMIEQFDTIASDEQKAEFNRHFGHHVVTDEEADIVRGLLRDSGALAHVETMVNDYEAAARAALAQLPIEASCQDELESFITVATKRNA